MRIKQTLFFLLLLTSSFLNADFTRKQEAYDLKYEGVTAQEHYNDVIEAWQATDYPAVIGHSKVLITRYPTTSLAIESCYYLAYSYFETGEYAEANRFYSRYLKEEVSPKYFQEAIERKFEIARLFEDGAKKHLMGWSKMPKWMPARGDAIEIYDEVITTLPRHDYAAQSLYRKAGLLYDMSEYKSSIETYQTLIRRFPKHPLAPECYLGIAQVFEKQCRKEFPDPNLLDLAEINLRKFRQHFPGEERVADADARLLAVKEKLAGELFEIGDFYQRTKREKAAAIYYSSLIAKYPDTQTASNARARLQKLKISLTDVKKKAKKKIIAENDGAMKESELLEMIDAMLER